MSLTGQQAGTILRNLGWPASVPFSHQIRCFQAGYAVGPALQVTGTLDGATANALVDANRRRAAGQGTASPHFSFAEFACRCGGKFGCDVIWVRRGLIEALEALRATSYPKGLQVVSGCRCTTQNKNVGGASTSQHLYGGACDVPPVATPETVAGLHVLSGIGYSPSTHHVVHVDVRHLTGVNPTSSTPKTPAIFTDGN